MRLALLFLLALSFVPRSGQAQPVCTFVGDSEALGNDCYQITDDNDWELGAVWFNDQIDLDVPFAIEVELNLGDTDADGADGVVFVMQSVGPYAIGIAGGGLGFEGFNPSFGVEIDTWQNNDVGDPVSDHVAFHRDGLNWHNAPYFNLAGPVSARSDGANIEDGQPHRFKLTWDPNATLIELYFDCELRLSLVMDITDEIFDGQNELWWGFTGSTGGSSNAQVACITSASVGLSPEHILCEGDEVELALQAEDGTVSWMPVEGLSSPNSAVTMASPLTTTVYTATWTDLCGETLTAQTEVQVSSLPDPDLPDSETFCSGQEVTLQAQVPADAVSILWSDGTEAVSWTGNTAGWQAVTIEGANGCQIQDSTLVEALEPETWLWPSTSPVCSGQDTLIAWPLGFTDWTVNGNAMPGSWLVEPGDFIIQATESTTGCQVDTFVVVAAIVPDQASLSPLLSLCNGDAGLLNLTMDESSSVVWSPIEGLDDANLVQPEASPSEGVVYTASILDECGVTTALSIEVAVLSPPNLSLPDTVLLCPGSQASLAVDPLVGFGPEWSDGSVNWTWSGDDEGWQSVTVSAFEGCASEDSAFVLSGSGDAPTFVVDPLCPGEFAFIPFPTGWEDWVVDGQEQTAGGLTVMEPGVYFAEAVVSASGCGVAASIVVPSGALPEMGLPELLEFCPDQVVFLETGLPEPVLWNDGYTGASRQVNQDGLYIATYTTDCGTITDSSSVVEVPCGCAVFAPSAFTPDGDLINDAWRPTLDCEPQEYDLKVFDRWGGVIWQTNKSTEYWTGGYREDSRPLDEKLFYVRDGIYAFQVTFRDPTSQVRKVIRKSGHILVIR